jgi:predicted aldo/keto reductase-like oxidoreductase
MLYRKIKKTGDELSILGFGCMRLPQKKGMPGQGKIDEERATLQVRYAIDRGVNYVDTAFLYHMGRSESFLGRALGDGYRDKVRLATKLPPSHVKVPEDMDRLLSTQLSKLLTDHIDYYLLHALNQENWEKMKALRVLEFLESAKRDGRIAHTGFSFHGDIDTFREIIDAYDWSLCQIQYNFLDENSQAGTEGLKYAAAKDLGVVVMEPLRGGHIAGKVPHEVQAIWDEAVVKRSPAEWALRWVWNHPEVTVALSGMNEEAHIEENIRIADAALPESLTPEELILISRVEAAYRQLTKAGCTGCRYCMPCPSGVNIPGCFEAYNVSHMLNAKQWARMSYLAHVALLTDNSRPACASSCTECGKCLEKCPQHLPIPDLLKDVAIEFDDRKMKAMVWGAKGFVALQRWGAIRRAKRMEKRHGTGSHLMI